jgi:hypothetical protein
MKILFFFHNYTNHRKMINTIWEMKKENGSREKLINNRPKCITLSVSI